MQRTTLAAALALLTAVLVTACHSDNASPHTQGAHNKPSQGGATTTPAAPPTTRPQTTTAGAGQTATYGGSSSGSAAGGTPTSTQ